MARHKFNAVLPQKTIDWLCNGNDRDCDCMTRLANEQEIAAALSGDLFAGVTTTESREPTEGGKPPEHRQDLTKIFFGKKDWSRKIL